MTRRRIALSLVLAALLAAGAIYAQDLITPNTAQVNTAVSFTYTGEGTVQQWCFQNPNSASWHCQGSNIGTFTSTGQGLVKVKARAGTIDFEYAEYVTVTN